MAGWTAYCPEWPPAENRPIIRDVKMSMKRRLTRREFLLATATAGTALGAGILTWNRWRRPQLEADTFVAAVSNYDADLASVMLSGLRELGVSREEIAGKRILLKPNLVEPHAGRGHINTHPLVVRGAVEAFLHMGASSVIAAEGAGHYTDTLLVLEQSGLRDVLLEDRIPFVDLNQQQGYSVVNAGRYSRLGTLTFPVCLRQVDWIVSLAKMKTHHWAGVTLSMKNLFGVMPGIYYGWPKNVLHHAGIEKSILDINATLRPHFAIVDGIVGMEGDGPIMGDPVPSGVLVMGRNLPAVDATSARLMGVNPHRIKYLHTAADWLGPIDRNRIHQRGENIDTLRTNYALLDFVPAQRGIGKK